MKALTATIFLLAGLALGATSALACADMDGMRPYIRSGMPTAIAPEQVALDVVAKESVEQGR